MANLEHKTRLEIIEVARTRFMRDGYKATSTRKIAQDVGITQPNLYHHFVNKEGLYVAVLETVGLEVEEDLSHIKKRNNYDLKQSLLEMTKYLQETHPFNFYMMLHDMQEELSEDSSSQLYQVFRQTYQAPFIELFKKHDQALRSDIDTGLIVSHYFLVIAPYISPDSLPYRSMTIEVIIDLFLGGIYKDA